MGRPDDGAAAQGPLFAPGEALDRSATDQTRILPHRSVMTVQRSFRPLQSGGICQLGGDPKLCEQWQEQTFAAGAANNNLRTKPSALGAFATLRIQTTLKA